MSNFLFPLFKRHMLNRKINEQFFPKKSRIGSKTNLRSHLSWIIKKDENWRKNELQDVFIVKFFSIDAYSLFNVKLLVVELIENFIWFIFYIHATKFLVDFFSALTENNSCEIRKFTEVLLKLIVVVEKCIVQKELNLQNTFLSFANFINFS